MSCPSGSFKNRGVTAPSGRSSPSPNASSLISQLAAMFIRSRSPGRSAPRSRATLSPPRWSRRRCDTSCTHTPASSSTGVRSTNAGRGVAAPVPVDGHRRHAPRLHGVQGEQRRGQVGPVRRRGSVGEELAPGPASPVRARSSSGLRGGGPHRRPVRPPAGTPRQAARSLPERPSRPGAARRVWSPERHHQVRAPAPAPAPGAPMQRPNGTSPTPADRGHHTVEHGLAEVPPLGRSAPAGSASSVSGSGGPSGPGLPAVPARNVSTVPLTSRESTSREEPAAVAKATRPRVISQLRATARGCPARSVAGSRCTSPGGEEPHTARRAKSTASGKRSGSSPAASPAAMSPRGRAPRPRGRGSTEDARTGWPAAGSAPSRRQPRTADWRQPRSVPRAAVGGRSAAPGRGGAGRPGRPVARWDSSSRNSTGRGPHVPVAPPSPGGAIGTPCCAGSSPTMGSPEKSDGSCTLAITVVSGRSSAAASWVRAAVLPIPGSPHRRTGRSAATASVSASSPDVGRGSVPASRSSASNAPATSIWEAGAGSAGVSVATNGYMWAYFITFGSWWNEWVGAHGCSVGAWGRGAGWTLWAGCSVSALGGQVGAGDGSPRVSDRPCGAGALGATGAVEAGAGGRIRGRFVMPAEQAVRDPPLRGRLELVP